MLASGVGCRKKVKANQLKLQRIVAAKNFKKSSGAPRSTELWMPICCISFSNPKKKQSDAKVLNCIYV